MKVLLLNGGSSSLKCTLVESAGAVVVAHATADWAGAATHYAWERDGQTRPQREVPWRGQAPAVRQALADLGLVGARPPELAAVGHRIVHGGELTSPVRIAPEVRARIASLAELAPLHNPPGLEALSAAEALLPAVPHVAVFDTAFHATLPEAARTYALPDAWTRGWGIHRFGFHGLSHSWCARRAAELLARPLDQLRIVTCHLGHGCSACAVQGGRSVDTTMGFTPLDGLAMATRSGSVDPGILTHVQLAHGLGAKDVEDALNHRSGLLGVSGLSGDMRELLDAAEKGHARAQLALEVYARRVRQAVGALAVTMGGIDAVAFTGGVGENAAEIRTRSCEGLECLGLELDAETNARARPDADVSRPGSRGRILVIAAREDLAMLAEVLRVIAP